MQPDKVVGRRLKHLNCVKTNIAVRVVILKYECIILSEMLREFASSPI